MKITVKVQKWNERRIIELPKNIRDNFKVGQELTMKIKEKKESE